jgi:16S rRNA (adenine1518-N6/adenine1519-N6)-dimethyltransferase
MKDEGGRMKKAPRHGKGRENFVARESFEKDTADESVQRHHPSSFILHPSKRRFGQNFLIDERVVDRIVEAVQPLADETIIEIGPGQGALTSRLVEKAGRVVAIEFDRDLVPKLRDKFAGFTNLKLIEDDALSADFCAAIEPARQARVVANLPYNTATAILQRLIGQRHCIREMILMLQREVVDRITAPAGSSERGFFSVLVEAYCEAEKVFDVSPRAFRPVPKVWSTVIDLRVRPKIGADVSDEELMWQVVSAGFAQRRKTILNNLRDAPASIQELLRKHGGASMVLCEANIPQLRRAETLTLEEWASLVNAIV